MGDLIMKNQNLEMLFILIISKFEAEHNYVKNKNEDVENAE